MSRQRKSKSTESAASGAPAWMATFADMMTLLLTFFILLYSMSSVDAVKFKNISESLQAVLSGSASSSIIEGSGPDAQIPVDTPQDEDEEEAEDPKINESTVKMYEQVKEYVDKEGLEADVTVNLNRNGVFVNIKEVILFEPGEADLKEGGKDVLSNLEGLFLQFENEIVVEGHTDNIPQRSSVYPTNWELSSGRATAVVRYLSETKSVPGKRLSAVGYGEHRPIADNSTAGNRALNRRVNLLIIMEEGEE
ncbi:flagellar motor protein MotB [Proteiniclasticum sp.]|uniref:flagellar motor protein MotB n=1 Tax=Proteiniclasticum sp. TaxID=2053595 RepID=UPI0028983F20|nr:flagellar motor protein MotB [Proteiniclasticum sp.]